MNDRTDEIRSTRAPTVGEDQGFVGDRGDAARAWHGALDELRVYDRALTEAEITLLSSEVTVHALRAGAIAFAFPSTASRKLRTWSPVESG